MYEAMTDLMPPAIDILEPHPLAPNAIHDLISIM